MTREEILQAFDDINFVYNDCTKYDTLKRMLKELTERKYSEWIDDGRYAEGHSEHAYRCSVCDRQFIGEIGEYNYCPSCGADMRREG